jgi:hypothetical protein
MSEYEKRDKKKLKALERSARADERSAEAEERAARAAEAQAAGVAEGARMAGEAALMEAQARQHEATARARAMAVEAAAKAELMDQQGQAAIIDSVSRLDDAGVNRVDDYKKSEEDRRNIQQAFDLIGDCRACVEMKGAPSEKFHAKAYAADIVDEQGKVTKGVGDRAGYRFANLEAAVRQLIDLENEIQRIRNWDANRTREQVLEDIRSYVDKGRAEQKVAAKACVRHVDELQASYRKKRGMVLMAGIASGLLAVGMIMSPFIIGPQMGDILAVFGLLPGLVGGALVVGSFVKSDPASWSAENARPLAWSDMKDLLDT